MRSVLFVSLALGVCSCDRVTGPPPAPPPPPSAEPVSVPTGPAGPAGPTSVPNRGMAINDFWQWFGKNAQPLREDKNLQSVMTTISAELAKIEKGVFAEIGDDGKTRLLVISVDGKRDLFPLVKQIVGAHPPLAGWNVVAFRQRTSPEQLKGMRFQMAGKDYDATRVSFVAERRGDKLDLVLFSPSEDVSEGAKSLLMITLDHTIGEYDTETRIGDIDFAPRSKAPPAAKSIATLAALVDQTFPPAKN